MNKTALILLVILAGCEQPLTRDQYMLLTKACTDAGGVPRVEYNSPTSGRSPTRITCIMGAVFKEEK